MIICNIHKIKHWGKQSTTYYTADCGYTQIRLNYYILFYNEMFQREGKYYKIAQTATYLLLDNLLPEWHEQASLGIS